MIRTQCMLLDEAEHASVGILTAHTGSRLQAPSRCSWAGSCRRGRPGPAAARPPLCRWVRGRWTSSPSPSRQRRLWQVCYLANSVPLPVLLPLSRPPERLWANCKENPSRSLFFNRWSENSWLCTFFSFLRRLAAPPSPLTFMSPPSLRFFFYRTHMHVQGARRLSCVWVCVTAGSDLVFFFDRKQHQRCVTELFPHQ